MLDPGVAGESGEVEGALDVGGGGLLGVDVLARRDGLLDRLDAGRGDLGVEVDVDGVVGEDRVEVGRPLGQTVLLGECLQRVRAAADQDRLGPQHVAVAEIETALLADREDRAHQVLPVSHATRDAVHGDAHCPACHESSSIQP